MFEQLNAGVFSEEEKNIVLDSLIRRVIWPYSILSIFLFVVGIFIRYSVLPEINQHLTKQLLMKKSNQIYSISGKLVFEKDI